MKRATVAPTPPGGWQCQRLRPNYESMEKFLEYKTQELNTDELASYVSGFLPGDLQGATEPTEQAAKQQRLTENMGTLRILEQRTATLLKCVQQDIIQKQQFSGELYSLQQDINQKEKEVKEMEHTAKEAQERAELLDAPYSKTNRWETWFPLGRPLQKESLPVLLSFALFFLTLALGMFLRLASLDLRMDWISSSGFGTLSGYGIGR